MFGELSASERSACKRGGYALDVRRTASFSLDRSLARSLARSIVASLTAGCGFDASGVSGGASGNSGANVSGDVTGEPTITGDLPQPTTSSSSSTDPLTPTTSTTSTDDTSSTSTGTAETNPPPESSGEDDSTSTTSTVDPELCDGFDNDGDGVVDEGSQANPECHGCTFVLGTSRDYWFAICTDPRNWDSARERCGVFGGDLAKIENAADQGTLLALVSEDHWIGMDDRDDEGMWFWVDGTEARDGETVIGYDGWNPNQPGGGIVENCAELDPGQDGWADAGCAQLQRYVCRHPA